jgi:hypothetical protein
MELSSINKVSLVLVKVAFFLFLPRLGGAYRHFMWIIAREVQSSHLGLLIPCPSAAANRNKVQALQT